MQVILKTDINGLGYENDIVTVKPGYGRNYLIPQGFAILADERNKKIHAEVMKQKAYKADKLRNEATKIAKSLEAITVKIGAKAGTTGKIYGSVNAIQIAEALKEQFNYEVDRKKIHVDGDHIKELGSYTAKVSLFKDIKADLKFEVFAE